MFSKCCLIEKLAREVRVETDSSSHIAATGGVIPGWVDSLTFTAPLIQLSKKENKMFDMGTYRMLIFRYD